MKKEKQRQQGHISILNHVFVLQVHDKTIKKEIYKKRRIGSLYAFNTDVIRHFNPLSTNHTKWSSTLKTIRQQFANKLFECV